MARNAVENRGIVIPQFANMHLYSDGYELSVTLNCKFSTLEYVKDTLNVKSAGFNLKGFYWKNRCYVKICKFYSYMDYTSTRVWEKSCKMNKWLKIILRDAKIAELKAEIETLKLHE